MPFKPQHLGPQIRSAAQDLNRTFNGTSTVEFGGSAQRAKESALKWVASGMRDNLRDSAAPWYSGSQPFTALRSQAPKQFEQWKTLFTSETDMGHLFRPPPPEPPAPAAPPAAANQPSKEAV